MEPRSGLGPEVQSEVRPGPQQGERPGMQPQSGLQSQTGPGPGSGPHSQPTTRAGVRQGPGQRRVRTQVTAGTAVRGGAARPTMNAPGTRGRSRPAPTFTLPTILQPPAPNAGRHRIQTFPRPQGANVPPPHPWMYGQAARRVVPAQKTAPARWGSGWARLAVSPAGRQPQEDGDESSKPQQGPRAPIGQPAKPARLPAPKGSGTAKGSRLSKNLKPAKPDKFPARRRSRSRP